MRYGYDSEYRRRRHGTYGATSSAAARPPFPTRAPLPAPALLYRALPVARSRCLSSNPDAIKWSNRAGVRKFDDEVGEKEAEEATDGRGGRAKGQGVEGKGRVKERKAG